MSINSDIDINYTTYLLPNGIKCILYKRPEIHSVSINVAVRVGSLDEDLHTNGLAHFIEHIVHDGTEKLNTWEDLDKLVSDCSGEVNAFTNIDITQYYGTFPSQYVNEALFYFSQIVLHPLFRKEDVDKERAVIKDELTRYRDEINFFIFKNIKENRFSSAETPFSYEIIGTPELLDKYTQEDLIEFYSNNYIPENIEIYILGNFDENELKSELNRLFYEEIINFSFRKNKERVFKKKFPDYSTSNITAIQKKDINQYYLSITFPGLDLLNSVPLDRIKQNFISNILASPDFPQSILWKKLREEMGIVYGVNSWIYDMNSRGIFVIQTSFDKKHLKNVLKEIYLAIKQIQQCKVSDIVFNARKKRKIDTIRMKLDDPENCLEWIMGYEDQLYIKGSALKVPEFLEMIKKIEFEDIFTVVGDILDFKNINIGIISKDKESDVVTAVTKIWDDLLENN